jgi:hypothetical protein
MGLPCAHGCQNGPGAQFPVDCLVAARAGNGTLFGGGFGKLQQLTESSGPRLVHGCAECHFQRFQVRAASPLPLGEDTARQRRYFARDLGMDRFDSFFSCGVRASSTGRKAQISSLTSTTSPHSF